VPQKPVGTPPPAAAPARAPPSLDERSLKALLASYTGADHFKILGVGRDATPAAVKIAYFQLAKTYHPDTVAMQASPAVKKLCADLFTHISEAWGVIGDDARRATYLDELITGAGVSVDVMGILQAETVFQTGTLLVKARQYEEAAARFTEALKLNPEEPEYGMWLAWCEFVGTADKRKIHARAVGAIEAGLKKSPRCVPGYLFLGQMAKIVGDLALAEKHLKRGLAIAPDHVELQRELKYLRK
jgi:tetratricopeptide (TPR) repeat protein